MDLKANVARTRAAGALLAFIGVSMLVIGLLAPSAGANRGDWGRGNSAKSSAPTNKPTVAPLVFTTALKADANAVMPGAPVAVPEDCNGIAPTSGSARATTQKQLTGNGGSTTFNAGDTVHFVVKFNPTDQTKSFDIRDCVVEFLPSNSFTSEVKSLITSGSTGQLIPTPGSTPAIKGYDAVLDNAEWSWPDNSNLSSGSFFLSWKVTVPAGTPSGTLICNYAKDTGGSNAGGGENRKAGACFTVGGGSNPTTTTVPNRPTVIPTTTTTTATTTTAPAVVAPVVITTTTAPAQVLGEVVTRPTLPFTGSNTGVLAMTGGLMLLVGGLLLWAADRRLAEARVTER